MFLYYVNAEFFFRQSADCVTAAEAFLVHSESDKHAICCCQLLLAYCHMLVKACPIRIIMLLVCIAHHFGAGRCASLMFASRKYGPHKLTDNLACRSVHDVS